MRWSKPRLNFSTTYPMSDAKYVGLPSDLIRTRSLSSPKAVERNQVAPTRGPCPSLLGVTAIDPGLDCGDFLGELRRELDDVLAVVPVRGNVAALADGQDRGAEVPHLAAGVVEVVLARHALAAGLQHAGEEVADERAAGIPDGQGTRRVGRDELDVDMPRSRATRVCTAPPSGIAARR